MIQPLPKQTGFTTVELLVTLFIAALFLGAGYQLYIYVMRNDSSIRAQTVASNVAYQYLNQYAAQATTAPSCSAGTPVSNQALTDPALLNATVSVTISCPTNNGMTISKIDTVVSYNQPQQQVEYSTYAQPNTNTASITNGLIAQWTFNGNANDSASSGTNGTVNGASLTTGENGLTNGAYAFSASASNSITYGTPAALQLTNAITISAWIKPTGTYGTFNGIVNYGTGGYWLYLDSSGRPVFYIEDASSGTSYPNTITQNLTNQWYLLTVTYDGTTVNMYLNGVLAKTATPAVTSIGGYTGTTLQIGAIKATSGRYFDGSIDDVRIYNRALNATEAQELFTDGAQ